MGEVGAQEEPSHAWSQVNANTGEAGNANVATGLALGLELVAAALIIAIPIHVGYSLLAMVIWVSIMFVFVLPLVDLFADKIILRGENAADNIVLQGNWGASILMGSIKVGFLGPYASDAACAFRVLSLSARALTSVHRRAPASPDIGRPGRWSCVPAKLLSGFGCV